VAGVGDGAAGVGGWPHHPPPLRRHHLLHLRPPLRLLPRRRPGHRQAQLHLHRRRQVLPRWLARLVLRLLPVRQHVRHRHRLHHHRLHLRRGYQQVQLLPLARPWHGLQPEHERLHHRLRRPAGPLLPAPKLPPALVAVHHRRRHVLLVRRHRRRLVAGADHHGPAGEDDADGHGGRRRRRRHAEGVAHVPGAGERRLRLLLRHHPHRDPGHAAVAAAGERDDAARHGGGDLDDHGVLPAVRLPGLLGVRERGAGQHPHRLRLLRAILAGGRGQRLHRGAPRRRVPGVLPAACAASIQGVLDSLKTYVPFKTRS
ncbi:Os06g0556200, partial [Oryza sativa Japonica Group]